MWEILPPSGLLAEGNDGMVHLEWSEPTTSACADEVISTLPFNAFGSNVGAGDDWLVQVVKVQIMLIVCQLVSQLLLIFLYVVLILHMIQN